MFMISLTILFLSCMSRFMDEHVKKLRLLLKFALRVLSQLLSDLWAYYSSPYPLLLIGGVFRRIFRRAKALWLPKGRGRSFAFGSGQSRRFRASDCLKMAWSRQKLGLHLQLGRPSSKPIRIFGP
jgi:hypothetical protein